jgi:hypothetical protein
MTETITAIYEKGMLRPLQPLNLEETNDEGEAAIRILVEAGLMRPPDRVTPIPPDPVPQEERLALAERLSQAPGRPLSEIVIEDRGER